MGDVEPAFRVTTEASGRWKIELVNFQKFEEVLTRHCANWPMPCETCEAP